MRKTRPKKQGKLTTNCVVLEKHEMKTVVFLLGLGYDIELIRPSQRKDVKTPDFWMDNLQWEMKSPEGSGKYTIQDTLRRALKQSCYIVVDLRRIKIHQNKCLHEIERQFQLSKEIRRILVITKQHRLIDFSRSKRYN